MTKEALRSIINKLDYSKEELDYLFNPNKILEFNIEFKGEKIKGFRIQHNNDLGPYKGGIRFHETVNLDEVKKLAFFMAIKTALVNIPLGGGKGGILFNPKKYDEKELEFISREYVKKIHNSIGPGKDIPAPDVYTNAKVMSWMVDEFENISGSEAKASFTGKPLILGGSVGRDSATARGGFFVLEETLKRKGIKNPTVVIQGFGNAGMHMAKFCFDAGFKVVGVSDSKGAVFGDLNIDELIKYKKNSGSVKGFCKDGSNEELLAKDVDVLVLAAMEDTITKDNAKDVKAKIIVELANGPISLDCEKEIKSFILPDVLANSGGVIVSYFEYVQNIQNYYWDKTRVDEELKKIIMQAYEDVYCDDIRTNCYKVAFDKLLEAARFRGRF